MHTHVQPCYRPTMLGSMGLTPNDRFLAQVYLMPRGGRCVERHTLLASPLTPPPALQMTWCTILRLLANAQDAQATSEIRKWTFAEVSFFRGAKL